MQELNISEADFRGILNYSFGEHKEFLKIKMSLTMEVKIDLRKRQNDAIAATIRDCEKKTKEIPSP